MVGIPVLGRLTIWDYYSLCLAFVLSFLERVVRVVLVFLPSFLLKAGDRVSRLESLSTVKELAEYWGYEFEEHIVSTTDGYFLGLHRLPSPSSRFESDVDSQDSDGSPIPTGRNDSNIRDPPTLTLTRSNRPVVLLWHGIMMNSEVFVCKPRQWDNLAFMLADLGYDVWLGNTRGNKYSLKHRTRSPLNQEFWDFSLDEFAHHDLPSTVDYVLQTTGMPSLTYIGFSQGTAQCFAALSVNAELNTKINLFLCLAPATAPKGLENQTANAMIRASPNIIYLLFGKSSALSMCLFWQDLLPRNLFVRIIDQSMNFLFRWHTSNMSFATKRACYFHLYSMTSVKCVVHWFQIIRASRFQFYDDFPIPPRFTPHSHSHVAPPYPTKQITCPIAYFYGGSDTLSDMDSFFQQLPQPVFAKEVPHYEHLDFLWADDLPHLVFPELTALLRKYNPGARATSICPV